MSHVVNELARGVGDGSGSRLGSNDLDRLSVRCDLLVGKPGERLVVADRDREYADELESEDHSELEGQGHFG